MLAHGVELSRIVICRGHGVQIPELVSSTRFSAKQELG